MQNLEPCKNKKLSVMFVLDPFPEWRILNLVCFGIVSPNTSSKQKKISEMELNFYLLDILAFSMHIACGDFISEFS